MIINGNAKVGEAKAYSTRLEMELEEKIQALESRLAKTSEAARIFQKYYKFLEASMADLSDTEELFGVFEPMADKYAFEQLEQIKSNEITEARKILEEIGD